MRADRAPWDGANGLRVGAIVGGVIGLGLAVIVDVVSFWFVVVGAVIGGAIGLWSQKRTR